MSATATAGPPQASSPNHQPGLQTWSGAEKPSFILDDLHGQRRDLKASAGKVVLVHFFATWCEPCIREMVSLQKLAESTTGKPFVLIAVDVGEVEARVRRLFETRPVTFPVLLDRDRAVTKGWDVNALPTTFVLAPDLTVRHFIEADLDWTRPDVIAAIEALYPATPGTSAEPDTTASTTNNSSREALK